MHGSTGIAMTTSARNRKVGYGMTTLKGDFMYLTVTTNRYFNTF